MHTTSFKFFCEENYVPRCSLFFWNCIPKMWKAKKKDLFAFLFGTHSIHEWTMIIIISSLRERSKLTLIWHLTIILPSIMTFDFWLHQLVANNNWCDQRVVGDREVLSYQRQASEEKRRCLKSLLYYCIQQQSTSTRIIMI